jgi:hypothetical protein
VQIQRGVNSIASEKCPLQVEHGLEGVKVRSSVLLFGIDRLRLLLLLADVFGRRGCRWRRGLRFKSVSLALTLVAERIQAIYRELIVCSLCKSARVCRLRA